MTFDDDLSIMLSDFGTKAICMTKSGDSIAFNLLLSAQTDDSSIGHFTTKMQTCTATFKTSVGIQPSDKITINTTSYDIVSLDSDMRGLSTAILRPKQ